MPGRSGHVANDLAAAAKSSSGAPRKVATCPLPRRSRGPTEMLRIPRHASVDHIHDVLRFPHAVAFAWIANHHRVDADVPQGDIKLLRLGDRHVVVVV